MTLLLTISQFEIQMNFQMIRSPHNEYDQT